MIRKKRIYEPAAADDGYRVLVDGLWPRGVTKEKAQLDAWAREIAPSADLRRWYSHDPDKWEAFQSRYEQELQAPEAEAILADLVSRARTGTVTLVYASKDEDICNAAVLERLLTARRR